MSPTAATYTLVLQKKTRFSTNVNNFRKEKDQLCTVYVAFIQYSVYYLLSECLSKWQQTFTWYVLDINVSMP